MFLHVVYVPCWVILILFIYCLSNKSKLVQTSTGHVSISWILFKIQFLFLIYLFSVLFFLFPLSHSLSLILVYSIFFFFYERENKKNFNLLNKINIF